MRRVVITGLGALTPIGNNLDDYWESLKNGVSGAAPITKFNTDKFKSKFACELKNFEPAEYFDRKELRKYDPFSQYALVSVDQAIIDSKLDLENINKDRVGVIWGSGNGGIQTFQNETPPSSSIPAFPSSQFNESRVETSS